MGCCGRSRRNKKEQRRQNLATGLVAAENGATVAPTPSPPQQGHPQGLQGHPQQGQFEQFELSVSTNPGAVEARLSGNGDAESSSGYGRHVKSSSIMSDIEWHECREDFSIADGSPAPALSASTSFSSRPVRGAEAQGDAGAEPGGSTSARAGPGHHENGSNGSSWVRGGASDTSEEAAAAAKLAGMSLLDDGSGRGPPLPSEALLHPVGTSGAHHHHHHKHSDDEDHQVHARAAGNRPSAGCSLTKRDMSMDWKDVREGYEECDGTTYRIRSLDYMRTRQKIPSEKPFYHLVAADMFSFEAKQFHLAKMLGHLPNVPEPRHPAGGGVFIPPLIIINIQLPTYPPTFFGASDGVGHSIVYYFALAEDFDPGAVNPKALGLLQRFVTDGREADGTPTRDRLKLIPRVVNVEEWAQKGQLNRAEHTLLNTYNDKPVLTRPQQAFHHGPNYLEIDLDIHMYAFLARRALQSFFSRLTEIVWENAFVIQGNSPDELPEVVLGAARLYRTDFENYRSFAEFQQGKAPPTGAPGEGHTAGKHAAKHAH